MTVDVSGTRYTIGFTHCQFSEPRLLISSGHSYHGLTVCLVCNDVDMWWSVARCSISDRFCKETGRQIALKRAVADLPRDVRGALLRAYFTRRRPTPEKPVKGMQYYIQLPNGHQYDVVEDSAQNVQQGLSPSPTITVKG